MWSADTDDEDMARKEAADSNCWRQECAAAEHRRAEARVETELHGRRLAWPDVSHGDDDFEFQFTPGPATECDDGGSAPDSTGVDGWQRRGRVKRDANVPSFDDLVALATLRSNGEAAIEAFVGKASGKSFKKVVAGAGLGRLDADATWRIFLFRRVLRVAVQVLSAK